MKDIHITITVVDILRILSMFVVTIVLTITGWKIWNWQYWTLLPLLVTLWILIDRKYGIKK